MKIDRFMALQILTASRVFIAALAVAILVGFGVSLSTVLVTIVLAGIVELTDLFDGIIARKYDLTTDFGKLFDPFTDSISRLALFFGMGWVGIVPLWLPIAMSFRDICVAYFRIFSMQQGVVMASRLSGKAKAWFQGVGTFLLLILAGLTEWGRDMTAWVTPVAWIILFGTLWSLVDYAYGLYRTVQTKT